jgi:hypothetical protein
VVRLTTPSESGELLQHRADAGCRDARLRKSLESTRRFVEANTYNWSRVEIDAYLAGYYAERAGLLGKRGRSWADPTPWAGGKA